MNLLIVLLLTSCTNSTKLHSSVKDSYIIPIPIQSKPTSVEPLDVSMVVLTPDIIQEISNTNKSYVYYGYDEKNYLKFAQWLKNILRYIEEQNKIIDYYEDNIQYKLLED